MIDTRVKVNASSTTMATTIRRLQQMGEPETWSVKINPHDVIWSDNSRTLRMFNESHGHKLPLLIHVTEGFDGIDGFHTFSSGDVSFIALTFLYWSIVVITCVYQLV